MLTEKQKKMVDMWNESGHVAHYYPKKNKIALDGSPAQSVASAMRRLYLHFESAENIMGQNEVGLWSYNPVSGYWKLERTSSKINSKKWLDIYQNDSPKTLFKLARNRPNSKPSMPGGFKKNPIKSGYSRATVQENVSILTREGYDPAQAVAIALDSARKAYHKRYPMMLLPPHLALKPGKSGRLETMHKNPAPKFKAAQQATGELKRQLDAAMKLYHNFSGHEPELVGKTKKPKIPDVGIVIGELDGVAYETVRDGKTEKYFHQFDKRVRPLLVSSFDGSQVYILGGEYDFTADGIVDATDKKFSPRQRSK